MSLAVITKHCVWKKRHWWAPSITHSDVQGGKCSFFRAGVIYSGPFWPGQSITSPKSPCTCSTKEVTVTQCPPSQGHSHSSDPSSGGHREEPLCWRMLNAENCSANYFFHQILPNLWTELVIKLFLWTWIFFIYFQCYRGYLKKNQKN